MLTPLEHAGYFCFSRGYGVRKTTRSTFAALSIQD
ncbi:MAG: hypothetical protein JWN64_122 [Parcubacteria group bacterium]|nr:hypothetical protein [Parcubacteria group bacterium]